ncbi:DUF1592 domain-containing protein [Stratiformator vulcanicus]|uniref:Cytochrome c domain-containing protein n=1 Tax=Stratiformator vulcanicus TaxID=2527980 RepID=A0A517R1X7_9PLAN|nr:DUF1592 domain-containing protein [Stratiformator vulcanicus]QDT37872.1 hypothetical protein Pan189_22550 [Stratiformator vulcanicus]
MIRILSTICLIISICFALSEQSAAQDLQHGFAIKAQPFLENYCTGCHGKADEFPEANFALGEFDSLEKVLIDREMWKKALDEIDSMNMPPEESDKPSAKERHDMMVWIDDVLAAPGKSGVRDPGDPVLRRLNRLEYNNTIRDLFDLDKDIYPFPERVPLRSRDYFQPAKDKMPDGVSLSWSENGTVNPFLRNGGIPGDNKAEHGFSNRGDVLNVSSLLLEKYMTLAARIVEHPELPKQSKRFKQLIDSPSAGSERDVARQRLQFFMNGAFRRPVENEEVDLYMQLYDHAIGQGNGFEDAMKKALTGVLTSPSFLFFIEPSGMTADPVRPLDDFELASRLSYFLWSSMPDQKLFEAAASGKLQTESGIEAEVRRMLDDPNSIELAESFAVQWLDLNTLISVRPDRKAFRNFYRGEKATLTMPYMIEALLLFETVLAEDRSVVDLIDPGFTYVDEWIAEVYGLKDELHAAYPEQFGEDAKKLEKKRKWGKAPSFFRLKLPDGRRGGVLGMGATLTLTSFPERTSPVKRGAWVLETVFNRPPPPPLPNAGEIKDVEDPSLTLREKLASHRDNPACAGCHNRMDPLGFALENYDGMGRWREKDGKQQIDSSGTLLDGRSFDGPAEFRRLVTERREIFVRGFVEKLLSYALGRQLEYYDAATVREIMEAARKEDYRFSTIVIEITKSYPFRNIRNVESEQI